LLGLAAVLLALGGVGLAASILGQHLTGSDVTMLFMIVVVWASLTFGRLAGAIAAVASTLASNFFFFEPYMAFGFDTTRDAIALIVFLLVAMTTSTLAAKVREEKEQQRWHAELAERVSKSLDILFSVSQAIAKVMRREELGPLVEKDIAELLGQRARLVEGGAPSASPGQHCVPLNTPRRNWGALLFDGTKQEPFEPSQNLLHEAVGEQVALALERIALMEEMAEARLIADGERLRRALMNSISHDLKTPIGSIMGAASSLLTGEGNFDERIWKEQLSTIMQASLRLNRYVRNLLDNAVIEAGALKPSCDWVDLADTVSVAIDACEGALAGKPVDLIVDGKLPLLWLDAVLIERVFVNLFENAAKFSPGDARIEARLSREGDSVTATIFNRAVLDADFPLEQLFEPYFRGSSDDRKKGAGLGLAICRAFMRAHDGEASAQYDSQRQGMIVSLRFPVSHQAPSEENMDD
jgi:two-component system sensor histidine kinase KdpD